MAERRLVQPLPQKCLFLIPPLQYSANTSQCSLLTPSRSEEPSGGTRHNTLLHRLRLDFLFVVSSASQVHGGGILRSLHTVSLWFPFNTHLLLTNRSKSNLSYYRRLVGQSLLFSGQHLLLATIFFFSSMEFVLRHLRFP